MADFLAGAETESAIAPLQPYAGSLPIETKPGILISGQNLLQWTVVSRIAASGKLTQWAPGGSGGAEKAIGVLMHTIDASGGDKNCEIGVSGMWNTDALVWPGGVTAAQQAFAFDNTKLDHRKLGYSG